MGRALARAREVLNPVLCGALYNSSAFKIRR